MPVAKNTSLEPDLQMTVTNAIIRRFNNDGTLEVNQNANADSELDVTITNVQHSAVRSSTNDILVTAQYQLTIHGHGHLCQSHASGRKIFENVSVTGSTTFFTQSDHPGRRTAGASRWPRPDLANNTVKLVTEGW